MYSAAFVIGWLAIVALVGAGWRSLLRRERAWQRLAESSETKAPQSTSPPRFLRGARRNWFWLPWLVAVLIAVVIWFWPGLSLPYVVAIGILIGLLGSQLESFLASRIAAILETQLADSIDIMIGAVGAGASVGAAIDAAITEARRPLRPHLEELAGRIRLGDDPPEVFRALAERIPLETFLLFSSAMSVHWDVGGRLAPTLTTVGRTIRDRLEISRRIRSNTSQSQISKISIVALTYFIAVIVWRNGPDQMRDFVTSSIGSWFVAASIILQAVGLAWMNMISKPRF